MAERDGLVGPVAGLVEGGGELGGGLGPFGEVVTVDGGGEVVAADVDPAGQGGLEGLDAGSDGGQLFLAGDDDLSGSALLGPVGGGQALEAGHVVVDPGLFQDERVSGGQRFDLGQGQGGFRDVFHGAGDVGVALGHLVDEPGFPFQGAC